MTSVAVCITSIPSRRKMLREAVDSAVRQVRVPDELHVSIDHVGVGAAANRNAAWRAASTEWIAFLDDDDLLFPQHLSTLLELSDGADLIYPWFELHEGPDPLYVPRNGQLTPAFGVPFGDEQKRYIFTSGNFIPVTVLVRRELLADVGGFPQPGTVEWPHETCEDWGCWQRLLRAGATFRHVPQRTWRWRWHGKNTSGRAWK